VLLGLLGNEFLAQAGDTNTTTTDTAPSTTAVKTGTITVYVQFNIGAVATKFEISPAGKNQWTYYIDENQKIVPANSGSIWIYPVDIYDNNYTVDIRVNSAAVWQNVIVKDKRLVTLGYNTGPYVVGYQDDFK